jgi:hypothetical protein
MILIEAKSKKIKIHIKIIRKSISRIKLKELKAKNQIMTM